MPGQHLILDLYDCEEKSLKNPLLIEFAIDKAIGAACMTVVDKMMYKIEDERDQDRFGYTGFAVLKESHLSIHTYPENAYCAVDLYSCKEFNAPEVCRIFATAFVSRNPRRRCVQRSVHLAASENAGGDGAYPASILQNTCRAS